MAKVLRRYVVTVNAVVDKKDEDDPTLGIISPHPTEIVCIQDQTPSNWWHGQYDDHQEFFDNATKKR